MNNNQLPEMLQQYAQQGKDIHALLADYQTLASSSKTFLGLNQWIKTDKPMMEDFNEDNRIIDETLRTLTEEKANMSSGTWTPTVTNATLSNISTATWRKNGTHVQAAFRGNLQKGSVAGNIITFGGLPFAAAQRGVCTINTNLAFAANTIPIPGHVGGTTAQFWVWYISSSVSAYLRNQHIVSTDPIDVQVTCDYETSI